MLTMSALPPKADINPHRLECLLCANSGHYRADPFLSALVDSVESYPYMAVIDAAGIDGKSILVLRNIAEELPSWRGSVVR